MCFYQNFFTKLIILQLFVNKVRNKDFNIINYQKAKRIISKLRKENYCLKAKSAELEVELNLKKFSITNFQKSNTNDNLSAAQLV